MPSPTVDLVASHGVLMAFSEIVKEEEKKVALRFSDLSLSYGELDKLSDRIAFGLYERGVVPGALIAVSVGRSVELVALLLAIWKCKAAYLPVDPSYPESRRKYVVSDSGASHIVVGDDAVGEYSDEQSIALSDLLSTQERLSAKPYSLSDIADNIAYIIYTSGSTGNPKGVAVSQANVANFIAGMIEAPGAERQDTVLAVTTISFDIHVLELFLPLVVGAELIIASEQEAMSPNCLHRIINHYGVSLMQATPATWRILLAEAWKPEQPLKVLVGGEALPADLLPIMHAASSSLWNMYGPTETTVWSTCYQILSADSQIFIGHPIRNTKILIVDDQLVPVKQGSSGELLIGGDGVSCGYHKRPELTDERFIRIIDQPGVFYRTGDLVVEHETEGLRYINRIDNQIKIRGFRIEPGDIEKCVDTHEMIQQSCIVVVDFSPSDRRIVCFYIGQKVNQNTLLDFVAERLPRYMFPQHFLHVDVFPKTANLKIDRKQLASMGVALVNKQDKDSQKVFNGARNELDRSLIDAWKQVLCVQVINIDDDFFDLGGHSLLAFDLIKKMKVASGIDFSLPQFFMNPTIRHLADSRDEDEGDSVVVTKLNTATSGVPVYCLCGVHIYSDLAKYLESEHPVYGVFGKEEIALLNHQPGLGDKAFDNEKFVNSYVQAIQRQNENNSEIILVGFSFGGLLAKEIATKMSLMGVKIKQLVMIDSYTRRSFYRSPISFIIDISLSLTTKIKNALSLAKLTKSSEERSNQYNESDKVMSTITQDERESSFDIAAESFSRSMSLYHGDAIIVRACDNQLGWGIRAKADYGWGEKIQGNLLVLDYNTNHLGVLQGDPVVSICDEIHRQIRNKKTETKEKYVVK